ncbi:AraC family transcriptional regulator [Herbaspirillum sp. Sphag1AN]|uniref:AraC family transcriptional regulator n=1 Tax=unclassified Herbaspirillum TaxID=2624150 RepID=UPI0017D8752C|nr:MULTISPECIES: AraC family transcriptional regulator [unclassified Herbaspirillum]MBB3214713.1 AraC family transcriptional regulator [Herbaspirillum sp. Sphag1AN]MBB3247884.1 AraC family transcriptional regulator [Herbaspirillum sp. Sphag64]
MMKQQHYQSRFDRLFDYIDQNLEGDLSVDRLSEVACFSKFHFHRLFSAYCGISVGKYLQLIRLKRASFRLAFYPDHKIIDIALESGFETPESFSRAFRKMFGQSPSAFRKHPQWQEWLQRYRYPTLPRTKKMNVSIVDFPAVSIAVREHRGPIEGVNDSVKIFIDWRKTSGFSPRDTSRTFGIMYDNPEITEPSAFRFDICGEVDAPVPENLQGIINKCIPSGRCAVVRHHGSHDQIGQTVRALYRQWVPQSSEELRDFPLVFHYLNFVGETPEHELLTDIYLPLK